jgi:histidinol-phosphate aminotransferase
MALPMRFPDLLRRHIAKMSPYVPIVPFEVLSRQLGREPEEIVKLDANENPYGPPDSVRTALAGYPFMHIYPDPEQRLLRDALSDYLGVPAGSILPGHGADELLDLICRVFLDPGDAIIDCPPTFGMYGFDAELAGAHIIQVPRRADFSVDAAAIERSLAAELPPGQQPAGVSGAVKLLFLTSPNNPDGGLLRRTDLQRLLRLPLMVVVDEAYVEFAGSDCSVADWVGRHENLIVLRTFSKWAGIAGLRLGYGIMPAWLMPTLMKAKQPYNVNVAATVGGLAALSCREEVEVTVRLLVTERERLIRELSGFPFLQPYPSRANFVLCKVNGGSAAALKADLARQGVLVRHYARPGLENYIRVSAGRPSDTDALLIALRNSEQRVDQLVGVRENQVGAEIVVVPPNLGIPGGGGEGDGKPTPGAIGPAGGDDVVGGVTDIGRSPAGFPERIE